MRSFMTDNKFNITTESSAAVYLFENTDSFSNGMNFLVQRKNENGLWGGRGDDQEFTFFGEPKNRREVISYYVQVVR